MTEADNYVLVEETKYGTFYWRADTPEVFAQNCIGILQERFNDGWYPELEEVEVPAELTQEQMDELPHKVVEDYLKTLEQAKKEFAAEQKYRKWYNKMLTVIANNDTSGRTHLGNFIPLAYDLLYARRDYEYEDVHIEVMLTKAKN